MVSTSYAIPQSATGSCVDLVECRSRQYEACTGAYEAIESRASYVVEAHKPEHVACQDHNLIPASRPAVAAPPQPLVRCAPEDATAPREARPPAGGAGGLQGAPSRGR